MASDRAVLVTTPTGQTWRAWLMRDGTWKAVAGTHRPSNWEWELEWARQCKEAGDAWHADAIKRKRKQDAGR